MATATLPYRAPTMPELLGKMLQATPAAPASINAGVPPAGSDAILRAVSGQAAARFETARDLAAALR
jgi:serine/threonine-protein kinase